MMDWWEAEMDSIRAELDECWLIGTELWRMQRLAEAVKELDRSS